MVEYVKTCAAGKIRMGRSNEDLVIDRIKQTELRKMKQEDCSYPTLCLALLFQTKSLSLLIGVRKSS